MIHTFLIFLLFGAGLFFIIRGGDMFVDAAARIAEISGIPPFVIGATVVSVATTLPELLVSVMAAVNGQSDMAAGNAVGSVTANTALILGMVILLAPAAISRGMFLRKTLMLLAAIILLWAFSFGGSLGVVGSCVMLCLFAYYLYETLTEAKARLGESDPMPVKRGEGLRNALSFILGAAAITVGSRMLVDNGTVIARDILHVDERVISLTLLAVGTSLPELVTAVSAVTKKQTALTAGNILGADIIDALLILPVCSLIRGGLPIDESTVLIDLPVCLFAALVTLVPAIIRRRLSRWQGVSAVLIYILYLTKICFSIVF